MMTTTNRAGAVSYRYGSRALSAVIVLAMVLSALLALTAPVRASTSDRTIGLPPGLPDYMKTININNFRFDPLAETPSIPPELRFLSVNADKPFYYIIQFNGPVTPQMKAALAATGATILYYVNYNAFVVKADGLALERARALPIVRWAGVFEPAYKLSPRLSDDYGELVRRALERNLYGDVASGGAMTILGGGSLAKTINVDSFGAPVAAGGGLPSLTASSLMAGSRGSSFRAGSESSAIAVEILTFEKSRVPEVTYALSLLGGSKVLYTFAESGKVRAEVQKGDLIFLARVPGVKFIDRVAQPYFFNDIARWVIQSGDPDTFATPIHDQGIWGTGQIVTLGDTGIDYEHNAFEDPDVPEPGPDHRKVLDYYPACTSGCDNTDNGINHGTHTAGTIGGDDGTWHVYDGDPTGSNGTTGPHDGQAFDAFIEMQDLSNDGYYVYFDDILDLWNFAVDRNSWIHSNSWGSCCSEYIDDSRKTDDFIWNNQNFLVVFAAGNAGSGLYSMNPYAGAKNVVAVGATLNGVGLESIADFSSRGPMNDGRLKPDVMAPGVSVWSARGCDPGGECDDYVQLSGTSMATPTVAGGATLVRQYFMDGWYPTGSPEPANAFTPTAALIKATLINSAAEMTGSGAYDNGESFYPNDNQGFGRILLDDALFFQGDIRGLVAEDNLTGINTGESVVYELAIGDNSLPVEITLVWSDYPDNDLSPPNLVNDLDLIVTAPDGTVYMGNQYVGFNPGESEPNPADRDFLNNVESVLVITGVQSGLWKVEISGVDIPQGPQSYALVMTGGIATEKGLVQMDKNSYQSTATVNIRLVDVGLNLDPGAPDTAVVNMSSDTEVGPEPVTMTETGDASSVFTGSIVLDPSATPISDGLLQVQEGDTITAEYYDVDDGLGGSGSTFDYALVDDTPPVISGVSVTNLRFNRATVVWDTDEPSDSVVFYDTSVPPALSKSSTRRVLSHALTLSSLLENTTYYFSVESTDEAGNTAEDDNATSYYRFTTPPKPPTAPPSEEWPTFHNNPPRQGISPSNFEPPIDRQWAFGPNLIQLWNGPVMADGILFSAPLDGHMRARDPYTGEVLWDRALGGQYYYTGTPSVENGVVYATFYGDAGGKVYALDELTGETIWVATADTGLDFNARIQMLAVDGLVFGAAWGGEIYALNQADGSVAWTFQTGESFPFGGPAVNAGIVYMGTTAGTIWALDEFGGDLVWSRTLDDVVTSPPLYAQGNVYVGTYSGTMYALDAFTGDIVWQTGGVGLIDLSTPAYDGTYLYFGSFGNAAYYSMDATDGTVIWQTSIGSPMGSAVAYANGFLYATAWDSQLRTLDAFDGSIVDSDILNSWASTSSPAVSDGWVWVEDYEGNIYGFLGQLPVGLLVSPAAQAQDSIPANTVWYTVNVKNIGISGPDTFDATVTLGTNGWAVGLWMADGVTPLGDTDGDTIPDTGSLATGESVNIVVSVDVPGTVSPGDTELSLVTFTSSNDPTRSKTAKFTTTVPPPGVSIGPRAYFPLLPGDTAQATMEARNTGGFPDTVELNASSANGWTVTLFEADGVTPLVDTDGDGLVDTGELVGLTSASIVVGVQVPSDAPLDTVDRTDVVASSAADPAQTDVSTVVIELAGPPSPEWPQFHHDRERSGVNPVPFEMPMTERWRTNLGGWAIQWTGAVIADHTVFVSSPSGSVYALDIGTGAVKWSSSLGTPGYISGTPAVAYGNVYVAMSTNGASSVTMFALDEATGNIVWSDEVFTGFAEAFTTATVAAGNVYWYDFSGSTVHANDALSGRQLWTYSMPDWGFQGPSYWGGILYVADVSGNIFALDAFTGAEIWSAAIASSITSAPTLHGGVLYVGDYSGSLYAIDALSGETIWAASSLGALVDVSSPVVAEGLVFVGVFDFDYYSGIMYALDAETGSTVWSYRIFAGAIGNSPAYNNGTVFVTSWAGDLLAFDGSTGALLQQLSLSPYGSTSSAALGDGYLVIGDQDGEITGFSFVGAGEVKKVVASPASADIPVTTAGLFTAGAYDAYDNLVGGGTFVWDSLADLGTILPIESDGTKVVYVAGAVAGTDTLEVSSGAFTGQATVNVLPGALDHVDVIPGVASVVAGTTLQFDAAAKDRFGNVISGPTFTWAVSGGIGTVTSGGLFTASTSTGEGLVTARTGTETGTAIVEVVPGALASLGATPSPISVSAGTTIMVSAQGYDQYGNAIEGLSYAWSTTIGGVTPTAPGSPIAILTAGLTAGTGVLSIASGGQTLLVPVQVVPGPVSRIVVNPSPATVAAGGTLAFAATPMDAFGNAISGVTLVWAASASIGTISDAGVLTAATAVGSGTVTVTVGSVSATIDVEVVAGPLVTIAVSPSPLTVAAGGTAVLSAAGQDAYGNAVRGATITWSATAGSILPLSVDGSLVQYQAPTSTGAATLTASSGAIMRQVIATVAPGPPASLIVSAAASSVSAGGTVLFTAILSDAYGNAISGPAVSWSASSGSISSDGVLTAPTQAGIVVVKATSSGRQATATIVVIAGALDRLEASPAAVNVATGSGATLTVIGKDQYGNTVEGLTYAWTTTIGSVQPASDSRYASFFAGDAGGTGTITVTSGGKTATISVTITESALPIVRQATQATSLIFLAVAIVAIAASVFLYVRYREAHRKLGEMGEKPEGGKPET